MDEKTPLLPSLDRERNNQEEVWMLLTWKSDEPNPAIILKEGCPVFGRFQWRVANNTLHLFQIKTEVEEQRRLVLESKNQRVRELQMALIKNESQLKNETDFATCGALFLERRQLLKRQQEWRNQSTPSNEQLDYLVQYRILFLFFSSGLYLPF